MSRFGKCPLCGKAGPDVMLIGGLCYYHYSNKGAEPEAIKAQQAAQAIAEAQNAVKAKKHKGALSKESAKEKKRLAEYNKKRKQKLKETPRCEYPECEKKATEIHHAKGRIGDLLTDERFFKALCREHHDWAENNPEEAKKIGISESRLKKH